MWFRTHLNWFAIIVALTRISFLSLVLKYENVFKNIPQSLRLRKTISIPNYWPSCSVLRCLSKVRNETVRVRYERWCNFINPEYYWFTVDMHKLPIYITHTCSSVESSHYFSNICLFSNCNKNLLHGIDPYIYSLTCVLNVLLSYVSVLLAMQWSVVLRSAFYS